MSSSEKIGDGEPPIKASDSDDDDDKKPSASSANARINENKDAATVAKKEFKSEDTSASSDQPTDLLVIQSSSRTPQDVLCGRGMPFQSYPGNVTMHELVTDHRDEYMSSKRSQKPLVIKSIIQKLKDSGARFLKPYGEFRSNEDDQWVEVDDQYVYEKISHVMRHRQRAARAQAPSSTDTQAGAPDESETSASAAVAALPSDSVPAAAAAAAANTGVSVNRSLLAGASVPGLAELQRLVASGTLGSLLAQQQSTQAALPSTVGVQDQEAILRALLVSGQTPLLSGMGLLGQPPARPLLGQNLLGIQQQQQQQRLPSFGQQQPSLNSSILAQLQQQQLLRGIALQPPTQPSSLLNDLVAEELRRRALQNLLQGRSQDQHKPSGDGEERK
ncbi:MAG: hypothetical protein SGILL_000702 [Bacillariaceae sp.]